MAKTYTTLRNLYGEWTRNKESANLTLGDQMINDSYFTILSSAPWPFKERTRTDTTTASTQFYKLPVDVQKLTSVTVSVGSTIYPVKEITSRDLWDKLNITTYSSNIPEYYYIRNRQIGLWPTPSASSLTITYAYSIQPFQLTVADYTTGTITTATNAATGITGSGTTFTSAMAGRYIKIAASGGGDERWYEIDSVTNSTTLVLVNKYNGLSISGGSATFIIGQLPILPEDYHDLPVYDAAAKYWLKEGDTTRTSGFQTKYDRLLKELNDAYGSKTDSIAISKGNDVEIKNPNLYVTL